MSLSIIRTLDNSLYIDIDGHLSLHNCNYILMKNTLASIVNSIIQSVVEHNLRRDMCYFLLIDSLHLNYKQFFLFTCFFTHIQASL